MKPKEVFKILFDSVSNMDMLQMMSNKNNERTFRAYGIVEGEFIDYNYRQSNVNYRTTTDRCVFIIEHLIDGKWIVILREDLVISESYSFDFACKRILLSMLTYGINHCAKSTKVLIEKYPRNYL